MTAPEKLDLLAVYKTEYAAPKTPAWVDPHPANYLSISGSSHPGSDDFAARVGALYSLAFTVKMTRRFSGAADYTIGKLEARWLRVPEVAAPDSWSWQLVILTPDFVAANELPPAAAKLVSKGQPALVTEVSLVRISEGRCVQMLHVGPYDQESQTFARMEAFARDQGFYPSSAPRHEIYLSDPRRVPPERLRTILRLPVSPA